MCFFQSGSQNPGILAIRTTYEFLLKSTPNGHRASSKKSAKKPETRWKYAKSTFSGQHRGGETTKTIFKRKRRPFATAFGKNIIQIEIRETNFQMRSASQGSMKKQNTF